MVRIILLRKFYKLWATSCGHKPFPFNVLSAARQFFEPFISSVKPKSVLKCLRMKFPTGWFVRMVSTPAVYMGQLPL